MWMGVRKRKPSTPKLHVLADIPLNKSFLKKITYDINFRFVTGAIQNYKQIQGSSTEDMSYFQDPFSPNNCRYNMNIFKDKCNWQPPTHTPKQSTILLVFCTTLKMMRFWSFRWLKNSRSKVCGSTCNYLSRVVNSSGFEKNWQWHYFTLWSVLWLCSADEDDQSIPMETSSYLTGFSENQHY